MLSFEPTHTSISGEERRMVEFIKDEEITRDTSPNQKVFLEEFIDSDPYSNYHATSLGTYYIFYEGQVVPKLVKEPFTQEDLSSLLRTLHFNGARCKVGSGAGICFTSPSGEQILKSFRLQFACSNNEAEYEGLI